MTSSYRHLWPPDNSSFYKVVLAKASPVANGETRSVIEIIR